MAHKTNNTVKKELDKRGLTAKWLLKKLNGLGSKICERTLMQIINNNKQDVTIEQLQLIAKVFEDQKITGLQWFDMIQDREGSDTDMLAGALIHKHYLSYLSGGISRKSAHERAIEDCVTLFKNWNK